MSAFSRSIGCSHPAENTISSLGLSDYQLSRRSWEDGGLGLRTSVTETATTLTQLLVTPTEALNLTYECSWCNYCSVIASYGYFQLAHLTPMHSELLLAAAACVSQSPL